MAKVRSAASAFAVSLVILGLAFVGATALAILFYAQSEKAQHDIEAAKAEVAAMKKEAETIKNNEDESKPAVMSARGDADKPGTTLVGRLADKIQKMDKVDLRNANAGREEASALLEKTKAEVLQLQNQNATLVATSNEKVKIAQADGESKIKEAEKRSQEASVKIAAADAEIKAATDSLTAASAAHQAALAEKDQATALVEKEKAQLAEELKVANAKIRDAHRTVSTDVALPDGALTEVLANGDAYIKLGAAERVRLGMTFEVFPANSVIHLQAGPSVIGKATVEVYRVEQHDCLARVVRGPKNLHLVPGDVVVNLAYDPHADVNFVVFGAFDINNTKNPNVITEDENRIKALITSSGANVIEIDANNPQVNLSPDVDYLVLGKEPKSPTEPTGDEATDVAKIEAFKKAQKTYNLYMSLMGQARQMQIPVLNQNRFLELVGFYHRAKVKIQAAASN